MTPAIYNISDHYRGDTFEAITFTIKENAVAIDLTGTSIKMDFRKKSNTQTIQQSMSIGLGITIDNAIGGIFKLDAFINKWDAGEYIYDAEITFPNGLVRTYFKGALIVNQDYSNV